MIGKLSKKFTIQEKIITADEAGGSSYNWQDISNKPIIFANIKNTNPSNSYIFGQEQFYISHKLCIRYRDDISVENRLIKDARIFDIQAVLNIDEDSKWLELLLLERI